jgi:hypothetical protein
MTTDDLWSREADLLADEDEAMATLRQIAKDRVRMEKQARVYFAALRFRPMCNFERSLPRSSRMDSGKPEPRSSEWLNASQVRGC